MSAGFVRLLDNYEKSSGVAELVTAEELMEINLFLDAVLETEVMKVYLTCCNLHLLTLQQFLEFFLFHDILFLA